MEKEKIFRYAGHMAQTAEIREISYEEGRAGGMKAWQIKNGPLNFTVMKDKCLDLAELSYKGINMSFLSKPGLQGRNHYDTNGQEAQRSIMGGHDVHLRAGEYLRAVFFTGKGLSHARQDPDHACRAYRGLDPVGGGLLCDDGPGGNAGSRTVW